MVLVPTSYLDKEKVGERALYALNAENGETVWKADLTYNPWGGATVAGDIVIVPGSSIGYYYKELKGAKGDLTALDLKTGEQNGGRKSPRAACVGCAAVERRAGGLHRDRRQGAGVQARPTASGPGCTTPRRRSSPRRRWPAAWCMWPTWRRRSTRST